MAFRYAVVNKTRDIANIGTTELVDKAMVLDKEKGTWLMGSVTGSKKTDVLGSRLVIRKDDEEIYVGTGKQTDGIIGGDADALIEKAGTMRNVWFSKIFLEDGICVKTKLSDGLEWATVKGSTPYGSVETVGSQFVLKGNADNNYGPFLQGFKARLEDGGALYSTIEIYLDPENTATGDMFNVEWRMNDKSGNSWAGAQLEVSKTDAGILVDYQQETEDALITEAGWYTFIFEFNNYCEDVFETEPVGKIIGYDVDTINEIVAMLPKDETLFVTSQAEDQPVKDEEEPTEPSDPDEVAPEPEVPGTGDGGEEAAEG